MNQEFKELVISPLQQQEEDIDENIKDFRICAICLNYTPRATYNDHMRGHGYETLDLTPNLKLRGGLTAEQEKSDEHTSDN